MASSQGGAKWPWPVRYGHEREFEADVLIVGGGMAGAFAAVAAAKKGASVLLAEKGVAKWAGSGGAGIDHWHDVCTNPACSVSPLEMTSIGGTLDSGSHATYIHCSESFDTLLELEKMGLPIRDADGEFAGAPFRDEKSGLLYAYDYTAKHCIRLRGGAMIRPVLQREIERLGITTVERIMVTSLLTEGGAPGGRVVGACGVDTRTGEFFVLRAKAVVLTTGPVSRLWSYTHETVGHNDELWDPTCSGDGHAMAWSAGAEFVDLESGGFHFGGCGYMYAPYGTGCNENTWMPCTIVDDDGKEIPWEDENGRILQTIGERNLPAAGQEWFAHGFVPHRGHVWPNLIHDLPGRIQAGEYKLPLYADLPALPEHERRAVWGLMIGNEGKTRWAIYDVYNKAGFDPERDMLQANVMPPHAMYPEWPWWSHCGAPQAMDSSGVGTLRVDWDLKTSLPGLYAAGMMTKAGGGAAGACSTGRYAGKKAAVFALGEPLPQVDRGQLDREKARIYSQLEPRGHYAVGWKELHAGITRVMQDYCGPMKSESIFLRGLEWLRSLRESEAAGLRARNPRELVRGLQTLNRLTVAEMVLRGSLARKGSNPAARLERIDFADFDAHEWEEIIVLSSCGATVTEKRMPRAYYLRAPNAATLEENYRRHADR